MSFLRSFKLHAKQSSFSLLHVKRIAVNSNVLGRPRVHDHSTASVNSISHDKTADAKTLDSMPGPRIWPILGNLVYLRKGFDSSHLICLENARKYDGLFKDAFFGHKVVFPTHPDSVEYVYRSEEKWPYRDTGVAFLEFLKARERLKLPKVLGELQEEEWANLRQIMNKHLLKPVNIKKYYPGFSKVAVDALHNLSLMLDSNHVVEDVMKTIIEKWAMESIGTFVFGQRVGLLSNPPDPRAVKTYEGMSSVFATSYKLSKASWLKYIYPFQYRQLQKNIEEVYENGMYFVNNVFEHIKECEETSTPMNKDIETSLVAYLMRKDGMSAKECASHAIDAYSAGLDTTSHTTFWLMYNLGTNPGKQEKLYEEVKNNITDSNVVDASNIQKMPYLRACFKESARLNPTVPAFARTLKDDIVLEGYLIPAKTLIGINNYVMGRDESLFRDANSFIPERWLRDNTNNEKIHSFASRPFGYGSRSCVGKQVAEAEMQVFISLLVSKFKFKFIGEKLIGRSTLFLESERRPDFAFYER